MIIRREEHGSGLSDSGPVLEAAERANISFSGSDEAKLSGLIKL